MARLALFLIALLLAPLIAKAAENFSFSGSVEGDKTYVHELPGGLFFRLQPYADDGWEILVLDTKGNHECLKGRTTRCGAINLASITPPMHGPNAIDIEGWHFRNADNTGPSDESSVFPQEERDFIFATDRKMRSLIFKSYNCTSSDAECLNLPPQLLGKATLTIKNYELTPPEKGKQARFTRMVFTVIGKIKKGIPLE